MRYPNFLLLFMCVSSRYEIFKLFDKSNVYGYLLCLLKNPKMQSLEVRRDQVVQIQGGVLTICLLCFASKMNLLHKFPRQFVWL